MHVFLIFLKREHFAYVPPWTFLSSEPQEMLFQRQPKLPSMAATESEKYWLHASFPGLLAAPRISVPLKLSISSLHLLARLQPPVKKQALYF